ncbi:MAG TPA: hypothetical protein ENO20_02885 [Bacteroides sp.]|nr:hypothetical protein [Bacteroides sp.]
MRNLTSPFSTLFMLAISVLMISPLSGQNGDPDPDHPAEGLMRGERLFYGLIDGKFGSNACAECHNTMEADTFNWNPSAWEIAHKYKTRSIGEFREAVLNPTGRTMSAMHGTFGLNESDVTMIKLYLDVFEEEGMIKKKPVINKIFLFLLLGAVLTWIVLDIFFLKRVKRRYILGILFLAALGWQVKLLYEAGTALGRQEGYEPDQPVKFSHAVHVAGNGIDCRYCHTTVEHSKSAGIPGVQVCWNCHAIVREGTHSGRHQIQMVVEAREGGRPIEWIRVHNLQDHVFFSHAQHVKVAGIDCASCHGAIEKMDRVRQVSDLSMGWCINCHRDTEVQAFDQAFYAVYEATHKKLKNGEIDRVTADMTGGTECSRCHY